ncbi:MAG: 2-amino-4-hydroxy-6-hydroxymethyldihydropteridine diphosphokinase [Ignavibacteria bacterium RBG_16_34_14]|nr:MAG: 2-amino-4-hydroxy-6-hydroxymethyldihydropteridine diphosphokinase [Ignavibacteria bacterium RBG_16_34_14]
MKNTAFIALGSNKGDKLDYLRKAINKIKQECEVEICSSLYETKPLGNFNQENFLNAVIKISTGYSLIELFNFLKGIEKELGRSKTEKWGEREIDLDILFFNDVVYSDEIITVPHKGIAKRDFVLVPLCEIEPGLIHPELKQKICDIMVPDSEKCIIRKLPVSLGKAEP